MGLYWPLSKIAFFTLSLYRKRPYSALMENSLYQVFFAILLNQKQPLSRFFLLYLFIKNGLYRVFFALLLYRKWHILTFIGLYRPLLAFITNSLFHFIALSKTAFICLYRKCPFSLYHFITLSKTAFICLY